jgi:probable phosphoglycerate mutase
VTSRTLPDEATVVLVRHAETAWSALGRHTGRTDIALTEQGRAAARALRDEVGRLAVVRVLCSPLRRARETATLLGWSDPEVVDDLVEWDYGDLEGLTRTEVLASRPTWDLWRDGGPGGEAPAAMATRADRVVALLRTGPPGTTLVVGHGHMLRSVGVRWIGQPLPLGGHLPLDPGARAVLGFDRGVPVLQQWNIPSPFPPQGV